MAGPPTAYQLSLNGATWIDANSRVTQDVLPDRLPDELAIVNSLFNLFNCTVGERGKIFQPEYGSEWRRFLQEPIDAVTARKMWISMVQTLGRWEPRITLDLSRTTITAIPELPGYAVRIYAIINITKAPIDLRFQETAG
jgi:phage baseplate assembly protein W